MTEGRCMVCKKQVEMVGGSPHKMKNGRSMMKGKCPKCGTTVCRIM